MAGALPDTWARVVEARPWRSPPKSPPNDACLPPRPLLRAQKADVWSLGVILCELAARAFCWLHVL